MIMADKITIVANAAEEGQWLTARKNYLTASDVFTWRGVNVPSYYTGSRATIIDEKFCGVERDFPADVETIMKHGKFDEDNIREKFSYATGVKTEGCNYMYTNTRWPHIAATIDGYAFRPKTPVVAHADFCHDRRHLPGVVAELMAITQDEGLVEIKKSVDNAFQGKIPPANYVAQCQVQMHVVGKEWCVLVAETLKRFGYKLRWDLRAFVIEKDRRWAKYLDEANEEFAEQKEIWSES